MKNNVFLQNGIEKEYRKGEYIYNIGDITRDFAIFYIIEGEVIESRSIDDSRTLYEWFSSGEIFGIISAYRSENREEKAIANKDSKVYIWNLNSFEITVSMHPELAICTIEGLSKRLRNMNKKRKVVDYEVSVDEQIFSNMNSLDEDLYKVAYSKEDKVPNDIIARFGKTFRKGEFLLREGEISSHLYIILDGAVSITQKNNAKEEELAIIEKGDILGEMSQFDNMPRSANARAITDVIALKLSKENFFVIFMLHPKWVIKLIKTLSNRLYNAFSLLKKSFSKNI